MKLTQPVLFIAVGDVSIASKELPANIKSLLGRLYEKPESFTLDITQGLSLIVKLDMSNATVIDTSIKFMGGKSSTVQLKAEMDMAVIDSMIKVLGAPPSPNLKLSAALPTFRPSIGGHKGGRITLPADIQFTFRVNFFKGGIWLGYDGVTKFKIGKQLIDVTLAQPYHIPSDSSVPYSKTKLSIFEDKPCKKAFGLNWLTIKNYSVLFKAKSDGSVYVEMAGDTSFGDKTVHLGTGFGVSAKSAGIPLPSLLEFSIDDGPKKVGALALRDLLSIYNEMAKSTGNKALVPLDKVPDVAIAGTGLGKDNGPKIKLVFEGAGDDGFDIRGKLRILGADVATIDKAFVKANSGLEIRANVTKFKAGPIVFPNGDAEIVVRLDRDKGTIPTPRVLIRSQGLSLFGSKQELDLALYLTQANLAAKEEFGDLFKFNFKAFAGFQNLSSLADLGDADFALGASLSSDPGQWIRTAGKKEVKTYFDTLTAGNAAALKALDDANKEVQKLDKDITSMRAKVKAERQPAINALKSAEAEVKRLQEEIVYFEKRRVDFQRQIKPCNQTYNICVLWKLRRSGCHKRFLGECVIPKYTQGCARNVDSPDLPARAWCEAQNTKPRSESAWALAKKQGAIAAKIAAVATLDGIRKSINKLPVDLDPRVAGLIAGKKIAQLSLEAAKQTVKGLDQLATLLTKGINALDAPDIFALETSSIRGNLTQAFKGKPVIIDLNYKVTGKRYKNRFSFTMGNQAGNARRFGVLALGIAVHETIKAGKYLKVVPHKLLDKVQNLYLLEMNKLNEELKKVTVANETVNIKFDTDPDDAQLTMVHAINEDQKALREQAEAEQKKLIEVQKNAEETLSQQRLVQLASLLVGNKWKQMPGTAIDIAAGGNGSVWMVATNKSVKKWTGSNWSTVAGIKGLRIDVGPYGHAWVVSTNNDIYRWNGKLWEQKPGQAIDIGVGADGTVWMVRAESGKSAGVQRWSWTDNSWSQDYAKDNVVNPRWVNYGSGPTKVGTPSLGRQPPITAIDVDNQGRAWIIHGGSIARWNPAMALNVQPWDRVPSIALDIGVGADGTPIASRFDDSDPQSDYSPLVWNEKTWSKMPGGASTITVDKNGDPWAVDAANNIWAWSAAATAPGAHITAKPWQPHGGGYGGPVVSKEGDIVTVTGMVKNGDYDTPL